MKERQMNNQTGFAIPDISLSLSLSFRKLADSAEEAGTPRYCLSKEGKKKVPGFFSGKIPTLASVVLAQEGV